MGCYPSLLSSLHTFRVLGLKKMRYVAAYLLAALGGNTAPTSESIVKILSSVGIEAESDKLDKVIAELSGKDLKALIAEGHTKLASMPAGGSAAPAAAGPAAASAAAPAEAKKEEKKEESEEEDDDMGFGLFD